MAGQQTQQDRQKAASPNYTEAQTNAVIAKAKANLKATAPDKAPKPPKAKAPAKAAPYQTNGRRSGAVRQANTIGGLGAG
jgi:hypothetical protein